MRKLICVVSLSKDGPQQVKLPEVQAASPGLISVVIICMTIMAVCALVYFAIRCYFDERRWRASAMMCKCLPPASSASLVECGNSCRYVEVCSFTMPGHFYISSFTSFHVLFQIVFFVGRAFSFYLIILVGPLFCSFFRHIYFVLFFIFSSCWINTPRTNAFLIVDPVEGSVRLLTVV